MVREGTRAASGSYLASDVAVPVPRQRYEPTDVREGALCLVLVAPRDGDNGSAILGQSGQERSGHPLAVDDHALDRPLPDRPLISLDELWHSGGEVGIAPKGGWE